MVKSRYAIIALVLILIVAASFRIYGLRWDDDLRGYPHPDERHLASTMTHVSIPRPIDWNLLLNDPDHSPLNPRRLIPDGSGEHYDLAYGALPVYGYRLAAVLLARLTGRPELDTYNAYGLVGREVTAFFSVLTVFWVYRIGRRTFDTPTGLLGAALLAVCVLHIQLSHFMTVDLLMSAMVVAGLLFCVRFAQGGHPVDAIGMGLMLGLGMATKFNGITLGAGIAAAYGAAWLGNRRSLGSLLAYYVPLTLLFWVAGFALFEYYAVRDPYTYAHAIDVQARMVSGETDWPYTRQYVNTAPYFFQLKNLVVWGVGWPLGIAAIGGVIGAIGLLLAGLVAPRRMETTSPQRVGPAPSWRQVQDIKGSPLNRRRDQGENTGALSALRVSVVKERLAHWLGTPERAGTIVLLAWAIPYFLYTARLEVKFLRYMLPLTPVLCLLAARLLLLLGNLLLRGRQRARGQGSPRAPVLRWVPAILVLLPTALWALAYMWVYAQEHPWQAASRWFFKNAPQGSAYTWEAWGDRLPVDLPEEGLSRFEHGMLDRDVWMQIYLDMPPHEKLEHIAGSLREADYVILSTPRVYMSVARLPWRYPVEIRYYELLFTGQLGYELVNKFTAFPGLGTWEIDDLSADQSFFDYDHPPVLIFRKTRDLSDQEWRDLFAEQLASTPEPTRQGDDPPVQLPIP